ncbi:efflux RND transporter permease subunit [Leptolyngbya cf. ectocarpi LEGE 11479]|uniref:Efflux RND transporter permease subunit n=1 Tax=Leptolyngbya cf. ectocarpi LEGE 11479 TaxID=1828722 RepID=A0A929FAH1_LEPEC|nr:efflux RND transporter permease subunit [Leptolyngbya ectocarpi]MBE9067973.1 efflux RND transporter permease subunit [Leptolyngbya cf. ectocarpi LEGE 11479]
MKTDERAIATPEEKPESSAVPGWMEFFFTRQIFAILLCFMLMMGGLMGYFSMVKEGEPEIKIARAMITTSWGGTDAETIENQVTDKLEKEIKSLQGLDDFTSATFNSFSIINVAFKAEAPVAESIQELRGKVDDAETELPEESTGREKPAFEQLSQQDAPILTMALSGEGLDIALLSQAAEDLQDRLEAVKNVREVNLGGQRDEVIHVQMIPSRLTTLGIAATQVRDAIQGGNVDTSWDLVRDEEFGAQVRLYGRFRTLDDLKDLPVTRLDDSRVVQLSEVAEVYQGLERETQRAFVSWQGSDFSPTINLEVVKVAGTDTIQVIDDVLADMELASQDPNIWPFGMEYRVLNNDANTIRKDLANLGSNVLQASLLVFAILFVALTWREALIAGLAIPMTFAGVLFILWMLGYTLNTMVTVGMILALGLLVDVFILMLEGLHDGIFVQGLSFPRAAIKTVQTYASPAFTGQLTTILAMAPLMAISGTLGKFIRLIPISAITCLVMSYVLALLAVVPLSKFLLDNHDDGKASKTYVDRLTETASERFSHWSLRATVPNRHVARLWTAGAIALFVCAAILFSQLPSSLFAVSDDNKLSINVELPPAATLETSQEVADLMGDVVRNYSDPNGENVFESVVKLVGQRSNLVSSSEIKPGNADYFVGLSAVFVNRNQRARDSFEYARDLKDELERDIVRNYPGAILSTAFPLSGGGADPIQIEIFGDDLQTLREISSQVQQSLREIPGTMDVRDDLGNLRQDYKLVPKREALDFYGISQNDLGSQGRYLMIDNDVGDFAIGSGEEDLEIRLSTQWPSRQGTIGGPSRLDEFATMRFITPDGEALPADALLEEAPGAVPLSITHRNTQRSVTVLAKVIPGEDFYDTEILAELTPRLEAMQYDPSDRVSAERWPQGYTYRFGGDADTSSETFGSAGQMLVVAIFLVFAVLVLQFGSYTQPLIIILTIPFALIGTLFGFFLLRLSFSFPAMIGVIALVGIVVNDAIVMVETMNERRKEGLDVRHAAAAGASDRLRPILTTSITTIIGLLPLAFSDAQWFPLCMAIIFGLLSATVIALLVVPGLYLQLTPNLERSAKMLDDLEEIQ